MVNATDLIDGIQMGSSAADTSSPSQDDECCDCEDNETNTEHDNLPTSDNYSNDIHDDKVPKYTDAQVDAVQR